METLIAAIVVVVFVAIMIIPIIIIRGVTISILWGWFMVPIFNLPPLSIAQALGVSIVMGVLFSAMIDKSENKDEEWYHPLLRPIVGCLLALAMGWIVKQYI